MGKFKYTSGWEDREIRCRLKVAKSYSHYQAKLVVPNSLQMDISKSFQNDVFLKTIKRYDSKKGEKKYFNGIDTHTVNDAVRRVLNNKFINNNQYGFYCEEVYFEDGAVRWGKKKKGFDFGFLDVKNNLIKFRNKCFGRIHFHDGNKQWDNFIKKLDGYQDIAEEIRLSEKEGVDIIHDDSKFQLIAGEIQFGNWALGEKDMVRILKTFASNESNVDAVIYITDTGSLEDYLSDGIVTFNKFQNNIKEYGNILNLPILLIGLDVEILE
jgi:hypothetical protein